MLIFHQLENEQNAAYYKYCRLFPGGERGLLVEKPFCKWKDSIHEFNAHFRAMQVDKTNGCCGNKLHMNAVLRATEFIKHMESDQLPIKQVMSTKSQILKFPSGDVKEDFIGYTNIMGDTIGEYIAESIIAWLQAIKLDPSNLRAQSYDGIGMLMSKCDIHTYQTDYVR